MAGPWSKVRRSTAYLALTALLVVGYLGVVVYHGPKSSEELFPFFRWELFSRVPAAVRDSYSIRLTEVNGEALDPPRYFEDAKDILPSAGSPSAYQVLQQLGRAQDRAQFLRIASAKDLLEARYLQNLDSAHYEVVKRRFDVVDRVTCKCFLSEEVIGEFDLG